MATNADEIEGRKSRGPSPFLYPLVGVHFFFTNRFLWPLLKGRLVPCLVLSAAVFFALFFLTYGPQALFLLIFHRQGAWVNAVFLVAGESAAVTALLFEAFFVDKTLTNVFDSVLVFKGHSALVSQSRDVTPADETNTPLTRLARPHNDHTYSPFSLRQIIELILLLPLNLIPWVGVPLFLWLTGYRAGPLQHYRYFELRGLDKKEKKASIKSRRTQYTGFGTVSLVLQLVPVLSMFFLMTTAAGSALWVARIEDERLGSLHSAEEGTNPAPAQAPVQAEAPPPYEQYRDEPAA